MTLNSGRRGRPGRGDRLKPHADAPALTYDSMSPKLRSKVRMCDGYEEAMLDLQVSESDSASSSEETTSPNLLT